MATNEGSRMKAYLFAVLAVILCAFAAQGNLLSDPSLETNDVWTAYGNAGLVQTWARRVGQHGAALWGWDPAASGGIHQDVVCPGPGTYTFTMYVRAETNFNPSSIEMKLEGFDPGGVDKSETDVSMNWSTLARDNKWHHLYVTATFTNVLTAYIRPVFYAAWNGSGIGYEAFQMDDASLYTGVYTGSPLANIGFDEPNVEDWESKIWEANTWDHWTYRSWARRSGTLGIVMEGWNWDDNPPTGLVNRISQPVTGVTTGDYTLSVWMLRETNHKLNSAMLRMEFFDASCSNKVQSDVTANLTVPADGTWHEYYLVGSVTSPAIYEVRPTIQVGWDRVTNADPRSAFIDDARFFRGAHDGYSVETDWAYHSGVGRNARLENVPGAGALGPFLQVNYATKTNTFYVLTDVGELAKYEGENAAVGIRTSWQRPDDSTWMDTNEWFTLAGTAEIPNSDPFHGLPVAGTKTVDVWKYEMPHPRTVGGVLYTNPVRVYYAPFIKSTNAIFETDRQYLLMKNGAATNNIDQTYGPTPYDRDYYIDVYKPPTWGVFTNGGFEDPAGVGVLSLAASGWYGIGGLERSHWGQRTGARTLLFYAWDWNSSIRTYQDVATTGGVFSFSSGVKVEGGLTNVPALSLRMEWYTTNDVLVQVDERSLLDIPRNFQWYGDAVVGACHAEGLGYVRLSMQGEFGISDVNGRALQFDDARFIPVLDQLDNAGFEVELTNSSWISSGYPGRDTWAARSGTYGGFFPTWDPGAAALFQDITTTGGTYEFSMYMQIQSGSQPTKLELAMQWYDKDGTLVQENVQDILALNVPKSTVWNRFGVVGACYEENLSHVRFIVRAEYDDGTEEFNESIMFDDISVVPLRTEMENGGFEIGNWTDIREWYGIPQYLVEAHEWAWHTGSNGVAFHGWETALPGYNAVLMQPVAAETGTYTFAVWIKREADFLMTDAELRLEWYSGDYPTKVQADTVATIAPPNDGVWRQYAVTGSCDNADLRIVLPVVAADWTGNAAGDRSFMMDDAELIYTNAASDYTDGIPNWWWDKYSIPQGERVAADDPDVDDFTNEEEYAADTNPTVWNASLITVGSMSRTGVGTAWSTNSRTYFILYKTNLVEAGAWLPYGVELSGNPDGSGLSLTVTNDGTMRFYRVGVRP